MTFNDTNNEINILDIVLILWKKKWNIALIVTVPLVLVFLFYPENDKSINKILVKTEIRPITYYEEGRYKIFNSYVESIKRAYSSNDSFRSSEKIFKKNESIKNNEITPNYVEILVDKEDMENLLIDNIDKLFLYNLFIDKLRQDQFLIDLIKKSNFIEEKNYASSNEYNEAVTNTVSQIDIYGDNRNEKSNIEEARSAV